MNEQLKPIINALAGPIRVMLMATFILLAKMGWITWATPDAMHAQVNAIMDFLVVAAPAAYAAWVFVQALRANKPSAIVAKAAALPDVAKIVASPAIVAKLDDPSVVTRG